MDYEEASAQYFYPFLLKALFGKKLLSPEEVSPHGTLPVIITAG